MFYEISGCFSSVFFNNHIDFCTCLLLFWIVSHSIDDNMFWVSPPQTPLLSRICRQLFRPRFHSHSPHLLPPQLVYPEVFIKHFVFFSSFIGNSHRYHFWLLCCYYGPSVCFHAIGTRTVSCWKVDMGSLICAMTSVHAVRMKGRQGLMSLQVLTQKNWKRGLHPVTSSSQNSCPVHQPNSHKLGL